ncbi:hypothetical protein LTR40_009634 [Exophiala xenobiotica]|nr:hypothetical protein LTR40_009634 [Exophiala xenobiotica]
MMRDRFDEAHEVIKRLHRTKGDPHDILARKEYYQMRKQVELDRQIKATTSGFEIFKTPANRRRAIVAFVLMWNNQFTGVLIIANYGILLYVSLGMTGYWPLLLTCLWVTSTFPGNIFCAFFVERFGRRRFMLIGLTGILVCLICEIALQAEFLGTSNRAGQNAAIFGMAVGMSGLYLADIILLVAGPIALERVGWRFFLVLIIPTALHIFFVYFFCPETKGRSLEDINAQFGEQVAVHWYGATETEKAEFEQAAMQDEENERRHSTSGDKTNTVQQEEVSGKQA